MFIKPLLFVIIILSSALAAKKESVSLRGAINTYKNSEGDAKLNIDSRVANNVNVFKRDTAVINATKKDSFHMRGAIATNKKKQGAAKRNIDSRVAYNLNVFKRYTAVITDGRTKDLKLTNLRKRGLGSIIFTGVTIASQAISLSLSLAQAITEGCMFYPSICSNKDRMNELEKRLVSMRSEYDILYLENKKEYLNIATANTNNAYITYFTDSTLKNIGTLQRYELELSERLEARYPKLHSMYEGSKNYTSEEYLDGIIGHLEYRLSDIRSMLKNERNTRIMWLAIQAMAQVAINRFVVSFSNAYDKAKIKNPFNGRPNSKIDKVKYRFGLVKTVFKDAVSKAKNKFVKFKGTITKALNDKIMRPIKNRMKSVIHPKRKLDTMKQIQKKSKRIKFDNTKIDKKTTSLQKQNTNYNIGKVEITMGVIGILADIATQVLSTLGWKGMAKEVETARINYEKHYRKFTEELNKVKKEKTLLADSWSEVIDIFHRSTSVIETLMNSARNFTRFNKVLGLSKLPIDINDPIFSIKFQDLKRSNIHSAQEKVINYMRKVNNDTIHVNNQMEARTIMYNNILTETDTQKPIDSIFDLLHIIYQTKSSEVIKSFGKNLTKKDLICAISLLRSDLTTYDFFQLDVFRPECNVSISVYKEKTENAKMLRNKNLMNVIVIKKLMTNETLPTLTDLTAFVKTAYFAKDNTEISSYGERITEKDIICTIASQFPSKKEFDLISLVPFRPDCEKVDEGEFHKMKKEVEILKNLSLQIKSVLYTCKTFNHCFCPSIIAKMFNISKDQVINLIRLQAPEMKTYCGTVGCSCVKL